MFCGVVVHVLPGSLGLQYISLSHTYTHSTYKHTHTQHLQPYTHVHTHTAPTALLTASGSRFLAQGSSINLTCAATNNDGPIEWRRDGNTLPNNTSNTLEVTYNDTGASYDCVARNRAGAVASQAIVLDTSGAVGAGKVVEL